MNDEVARWAASRAPELLARAEEQALAYLSRALIEAALTEGGRGRRQPEPQAPPAAAPRDAEKTGAGLWVYCVVTAGAELPVGDEGIEREGRLERIEHAGLAALVSPVPLTQYSGDALRESLNDLEWLERIARRHEAVLEKALAGSTIVPLRLCTIYEGRDGVVDALKSEHDSFSAALERLEAREEWGVKVILDRSVLETAVRASNQELGALEAQLEASSSGGAYMMGRRIDREVRELSDRRLQELVDDVHARLQDWAVDVTLNAPQNRDLSRHEGEMVLNGAYLVDAEKVDRFRELVRELDADYGELGASFELTGPWPPYNFIPPSSSAAGPTRA